ncbi:hypothetical protein MTO96_049599 [Rhipicephalus appendiculatus]
MPCATVCANASRFRPCLSGGPLFDASPRMKSLRRSGSAFCRRRLGVLFKTERDYVYIVPSIQRARSPASALRERTERTMNRADADSVAVVLAATGQKGRLRNRTPEDKPSSGNISLARTQTRVFARDLENAASFVHKPVSRGTVATTSSERAVTATGSAPPRF